MRWNGLRAVLAACLFVGAAAAKDEGASDGAIIKVPANGCVLANNVWDRKQAPAGYTQSVFLEDVPGWRWSAPKGSSKVLGMPEIICGDKPWDAPLGLRKEFPFRAADKRLQVSFDVDLDAEGRYNMAFSLWAVSKLPAVQKHIALEIMIWNVRSGQQPTGDKIGLLETGGTTFDLYLEKDQGMVTGPDPFTWPLVQYVARKPLLKGTLDFGIFLDDLVKRQLLKPSDYLTSVELGTEVWQGTGRVALKRFEVVLH